MRIQSVEQKFLLGRGLAILATVVCIGVVVWIDIATGLWQEAVILSGVAAGILTFLLTSFFLDSLIAKGEHKRWIPVTHLAVTEILLSLSKDTYHSHLSGDLEPQYLDYEGSQDEGGIEKFLDELRKEREAITDVMSRWAVFLTSNADVSTLMLHIAELGVALENIHDHILKKDEVSDVVRSYNTHLDLALAEAQDVLNSLK